MSQENNDESRKYSLIPPALVCLILSLLLMIMSLLIWRSYQEKLVLAGINSAELAQEKARLEGLLQQPPCETQAQIR